MKQGIVDKTEIAKLAVQDLNSRLGLYVRYEMRKVKCLVFVKTDKAVTDTLANEKGGKLLSTLVLYLDMEMKYPPFIDETDFIGGLNFQDYHGTIAGLRKELQRHGLDMIEAEREIGVMIMSDSNVN